MVAAVGGGLVGREVINRAKLSGEYFFLPRIIQVAFDAFLRLIPAGQFQYAYVFRSTL